MHLARPDRQRGIALVGVLWVVALMAVIAAAVIGGGRADARRTRNLVDRAAAEALAEAGISRAILMLLQPAGAVWRFDGTVYDFAFGGRIIRVSIQDEAGKVDLNAAPPDLLGSLFIGAGVAPSVAKQTVEKLEDWREGGERRRLNGAKGNDYQSSGYAYGPRTGALQSTGELALVMGIGSELQRRVADGVTVHSARATIDPALAPRASLLALPEMDRDKVDAVLAARRAAGSSIAGAGSSIGGRAYTLRAEVVPLQGAGTTFTREAIIRLTDVRREPYWVHSWSAATMSGD